IEKTDRVLQHNPPKADQLLRTSEMKRWAISDISCRSSLTRRAALYSIGERFVSDPAVRSNRQPFAYVIAQLLFRVLRQFGDHLPLWADWRGVRTPEIVEARVHHRDADHARFDRLKSRLFPELLHRIALRIGGTGLHHARQTQRLHRGMQRTDWQTASDA